MIPEWMWPGVAAPLRPVAPEKPEPPTMPTGQEMKRWRRREMAHSYAVAFLRTEHAEHYSPSQIAKRAYEVADAMMDKEGI